MESWMAAALGAVLITVGFAFLWALGGFFRGVGNTILLFTASFGAGAVLYPWVIRILRPARSQPSGAHSADAVVPPQTWEGEPFSDSRPGEPQFVDISVADPGPDEPAAREVAADRDWAVETPPELDAGALAGPDTLAGSPPDAGEPMAEDDFTELKGVGPVLDGRLKDAGIRTFGRLAALTPADVAEIVGWSEERVARSEIIEQAQAAANQG
jgi:predicted flap endonuclease-1-like 5' DNA nuclease